MTAADRRLVGLSQIPGRDAMRTAFETTDVKPLPRRVVAAARRVVAANAKDEKDLRALLDALGVD